MVPIRLKAEGFLSFRDPLEINFEELYEDGIFLISGPTGSGKTSLFDAISYALYGESPTTGREKAKDLRSHLIPADGAMEVEYEFLAGGRTYLVRRWQKGDGKVVNQRLVIEGDEENALTKVNDIKDAVGDVLGLTADQFCKIVMLPQGEFQSFLIASSKDKSEILRKLFDTEHYARIRFLIKDKLDSILGKVRNAETVLEQEKRVSDRAGKLIDPQEIQDLIEAEHKESAEEKKHLDTMLDLLRSEHRNQELLMKNGEKLNADLKKREELNRALTEDLKLEDQFKAAEKRADQLNRVRPLSVSYHRLVSDRESLSRLDDRQADYSRDLTEREKALAEAKADFEKNQDRQEEIARLSARITRIDEITTELDRLKGLKKDEEQSLKALQGLSVKLDRSENILAEIGDLRTKVEEGSRLEIHLTNLCNELKDQHREKLAQLKALKDYQDLKKKLEDNNVEQVSCSEDLGMNRKEHDAAKGLYQALKSDFEKQGLAQFTHLISEGEPCPLCGSNHHPTIFRSESAIEQKEVAAAEAEVSAKERRIIQLENKLEHLSEAKEEIEKKLKEFQEEHSSEDLALDPEGLTRSLEELKQETIQKGSELETCQKEGKASLELQEQLNGELKALEGVKTEHDQTKEGLSILRSRISDLVEKTGDQDEGSLKSEKKEAEDAIATGRQQIRRADAAFRNLSEEVTRLKANLTKTLEDIEELNVRIKDQKTSFQASLIKLTLSMEEFLNLEKDLDQEESLRKEARRFFARLEDARTRLKVMEENLAGQAPQDLEALKEQIRELSEKIEDTRQAQEAAIRRENSLHSALTRIRLAVRELEQHKVELETARKLDQTTGRGTTFENYVLGYYLDGVLLNANSRLRNMTAGRFSLVRQAKDSGDRRAIEGLDINVFDAYSNSQRDVKTLSGGESFKASLSMALGLSDFIQETKSGIRLETIFIDEGFGSLDQESLDSAMETILDIQGQGRLVGIISHVEELKERIPAQLIVENNGAAGSTVRIRKQ